MKISRSAMLAWIVATPTITQADPIIEVGGTTGVHFYSGSSELGVPDLAMSPSQRNATPIGVRVGAFWLDHYGVEGELALLPTVSRVQSFDVMTLTYRLQGVYQYPLPMMPKVVPFGLVGFGAMSVVSTEGQDTIGRDTDAMFYLGAGSKYLIKDGWGARGDLRMQLGPSSVDDSATADYEVLLSVYKEFGREKEPVINRDSDSDGILNDVDACAMEPEDKDGFEDENGCPDPDNDQDQIADATDKCPVVAEDKDSFEDEDGCPENDNDKDTIVDASDACANDPEDKDAFEDEDGCPEADNDKDGIADASDKCVLEPETANGFEDTDGCPDVLPVVVQQFTGVIQGINFKVGKAEILASSNKTLDAAVGVLVQFPDLKLEIQGHTDDKPVIKYSQYKDNVELSKARAEAVKDYLVKKGIAADRLSTQGYGDTQPVESPVGLERRALEAARAKNRRVEFKVMTQAPTTSTTPATPTTPAPAPAPAPTP